MLRCSATHASSAAASNVWFVSVIVRRQCVRETPNLLLIGNFCDMLGLLKETLDKPSN